MSKRKKSKASFIRDMLLSHPDWTAQSIATRLNDTTGRRTFTANDVYNQRSQLRATPAQHQQPAQPAKAVFARPVTVVLPADVVGDVAMLASKIGGLAVMEAAIGALRKAIGPV